MIKIDSDPSLLHHKINNLKDFIEYIFLIDI